MAEHIRDGTGESNNAWKIDDDNAGKVKMQANGSDDVSVQNPLPCDGDSIYVKDLDVPNCDNGDFSGSVTDYFDSLKTINTNTTSDNPKTIKLWFNRTIYAHSIGFGCDNLAKGFGSSITVKLLGSGEAVRFTKTFTPSDPNSFLAELGPKAFNGIILEFNTASEVCLSNITVQKSQEVNASLNGLDPNGDVQNVNVTQDGNLTISDNSSGLAIAKGDVTGTTFVSKFGQNEDIGTGAYEDIWDGGGTYTWPANGTAPITHLYSTGADTVEIEVQGLDIDGELVVQTKTLTGTTVVALDTALWRVFRMKNLGSTDIGSSNIVHASDSGKTVSYAQIQNGNNQTLMALYTIPAGKIGYLLAGSASIVGLVRDYSIDGHVYMRSYGGVFQLKHTFGAISDGTSVFQHRYHIPLPIPAKTDITVKAISSKDGGILNATFDIVLVDN